MSKPLNIELSREIASQIKRSKSNCFFKAYEAALLVKGASYVQGFLVLPNAPYTPIEYAWLELEDCLVDPTPKHLNNLPLEPFYFPAQRLTLKKVKAAVEEAKEDYPEDDPLPVYGNAPYEYYGEVMLGGKEYQEAYKQALAQSEALKQQELNEAN